MDLFDGINNIILGSIWILATSAAHELRTWAVTCLDLLPNLPTEIEGCLRSLHKVACILADPNVYIYNYMYCIHIHVQS